MTRRKVGYVACALRARLSLRWRGLLWPPRRLISAATVHSHCSTLAVDDPQRSSAFPRQDSLNKSCTCAQQNFTRSTNSSLPTLDVGSTTDRYLLDDATF